MGQLEIRTSVSAPAQTHPPGALVGGFQEGVRATFSSQDPGLSLVIDDQLMVGVNRESGTAWTWAPGFFAGQVRAELISEGRVVGIWHLDVAASAEKLGSDTFLELMEEIIAEDPGLLLGDELATNRFGELGTTIDPALVYAKLRLHGPTLLASLEQIVRRPLSTSRSTRLVVPLHRARRADRRTVQMLLSGPDHLSVLTHSSQSFADGEVPQLDVPSTERHLDGPANRCMTAMIRNVQRGCSQVIRQLDVRVAREKTGSARSLLQNRWPRRREFLVDFHRKLARLLLTSPYSAVTTPEITSAGLNAISADPLYSRAFKAGWSSLRQGMSGEGLSLALWLGPTWEVYERWCFVKIASGIKAALDGGGMRWKRVRRGAAIDSIAWRGRSPSGCRVTIYSQPSFPSNNGIERDRFHSVSRSRRPDIVLKVADASGKVRFLVLDAKYRTSRAGVLDGMASAHIYRDSLRFGSDRPEVALLLVPRGGGAPWLEGAAFQTEHGVGVVPFAPGMVDDLIARMVSWTGLAGITE